MRSRWTPADLARRYLDGRPGRALLLAPYLGESNVWTWIGGYGSRDRFAKANALFATHLPPGHALTIAGGHDWRTWSALWEMFLRTWTGTGPRQADRASRS